jgi:hypothetical protein
MYKIHLFIGNKLPFVFKMTVDCYIDTYILFTRKASVDNCFFFYHHHHHNKHNQGLGLKTCSFKAEGVLGLSIFLLVFPYPRVPEVRTGKPSSVRGFCPFLPGRLTISFDTVLYLLICCPFSISYVWRGFSGSPICKS